MNRWYHLQLIRGQTDDKNMILIDDISGQTDDMNRWYWMICGQADDMIWADQ